MEKIQTKLALFETIHANKPKKIFLGQEESTELDKVLYDNDFKLDPRPFPSRTTVFGCFVYKVDDKNYIGVLD